MMNIHYVYAQKRDSYILGDDSYWTARYYGDESTSCSANLVCSYCRVNLPISKFPVEKIPIQEDVIKYLTTFFKSDIYMVNDKITYKYIPTITDVVKTDYKIYIIAILVIIILYFVFKD